MIEVQNLEHCYRGKRALVLPHWRAESGSRWLVLGHSGCGKSTLLHVLAGLLKPTQGEVRVGGEDLTRLSESARDRLRGRCFGIVLQRLHLIPALRVRDNLALALRFSGQSENLSRVHEALAQVGLGNKARAFPYQLSQGEAQRVAIARAVIHRPQVLLADEPTSALDDENTDRVLALLTGAADSVNATLVIATHDGRIKAHFSNRLELKIPS